MKKINFFLCTLLFCLVFQKSFAQPTPPNGKKWEKIEAMSDEFNGSSLNMNKWDDQDPGWQGRRPARFEKASVKVQGGNLRITASKKSRTVNGFSHNGGLVRSRQKQTYGYYEARMKANKTFMSSTFWLFSNKNEQTGCDVRDTELDVTENVGINTGGQSWINRNIVTINSNTHSRRTSCPSTPVGIRGAKSDLGGPAYEKYYTFGVWWKGPKELLFYVDGKFVHKITPVSNFNIGMYLRMVVETYDWNPPRDGRDGMNSSLAERTTLYDWVRSYKLVNCNANCGSDPDPNPVAVSIDCNSLPSSLITGTTIEVPVNYSADQNRDVVVELWNAGWLAQGRKTVSAGSGTTTVTINLNNAPAVGTNYTLKASVRPVDAGWQQNIEACSKGNITLSATTPPDPDPVAVSIDCNSLPSSLITGTTIEVSVNYSADQNRDVVVELWNAGWLGQGRKTVGVGSGTTTVTINLNNAPAAGTNYTLKASVRPVDAGWQQNIESCSKGNITLSATNTDPDPGPDSDCVPSSIATKTISNQTFNYTSDPIDISCVSRAKISLRATGAGSMENSDYLRIYYKVDGGSRKTILENVNTYAANTLTANDISGNSLELIIEGKTSVSSEIYTVENISISEDDGGNNGDVTVCNTSNVVTGLQSTANTNNSVTIAFNQLSGVKTYELRAFNKGTFNGSMNGAVSFESGSGTPLTIGGLNAGTEYTFVIRALCNSGGPSPASQVNGSTSGSGGDNGSDVGAPDNGSDSGCTGRDTFDQGVRIVPNANSWKDSYKANGYCFCKSSFDHGVGNFKITINGQGRNIRDICDELKKHPRFRDLRNGDPRYNTIQCGNDPGHGDAITIQGKRIKDEKVCPGRVDQGSKGCKCKGPKFDTKWLSSRKRFGGNGRAPEPLNTDADNLNIYPNPINAGGASFLRIYSAKDGLGTISIHDLSGRRITSMNHTGVKNSTSEVEITRLIDAVSSISGAYIITYKTRAVSMSKVIIVK